MFVDGRPVVAMYYDLQSIVRTALITVSPNGDYTERVKSHPAQVNDSDKEAICDSWDKLTFTGAWTPPGDAE